MKRIVSTIIIVILTFCFTNIIIAEENNNDTELNIFTGMFDFSDDKQKAGLIGLQHQNEELWRKSFLGKLSPITGGFLTENTAFYLYSGVQAEYELGFLTITPSFAPGFYGESNGKDVGYPLEFGRISLNAHLA